MGDVNFFLLAAGMNSKWLPEVAGHVGDGVSQFTPHIVIFVPVKSVVVPAVKAGPPVHSDHLKNIMSAGLKLIPCVLTTPLNTVKMQLIFLK